MILNQCLKRYDTHPCTPNSLNTPYRHDTDTNHSQPNEPDLIANLAPKLGLYPPLVVRAKETSNDGADQLLPPPNATQEKPMTSGWPGPHRVLVVDDNVINRRLLSVFINKHKLPSAEAKDGKEALETYRNADETFDIILMDISMPVMDGMTSTRLIREFEDKNTIEPAHIIVLTGLTSANAKLEAWASGVDDFLTKPVDFSKLESLMKAGRGGDGTGFLKDNKNLPSKGP
jgi:CheY-like chemotaxis protein